MAVTIAISCNSENSQNGSTTELSISQKNEIEFELKGLLERDTEDSFLIIIEQNSDNFVQFVMNSGALEFDLPASQLDDDQLLRAQEILGEYNITMELEKMYDDVDTDRVVGEFRVFHKAIPNNKIDLSLEITEKLITQVFQPNEDVQLKITKN